MKYIYISLFIVALTFLSCNKPLPDYSHQPFTYTVTGISDVSVPANSNIFISAHIALLTGNPATNPVTLTFNGLPANVFLSKNGFSFLLNSDISDSFGARNATPGVYPVQAQFSSPSSGTQAYNFNLTVTAPVNRVANAIGSFYPSNSCWKNIYVSCEIDSVPGTPGKIMIIDRTSPDENTYGTFDTTYGFVDCCTNTFMIPVQRVQGTTVSGSGTFNEQQWPYKVETITRIIVTDTATYECTVQLSQS